MESIQNIFSGRIPKHTPEEWEQINDEVAKWEEEEAIKLTVQRKSRAGIPKEFAYAFDKHPDPAIVEWRLNPTTGLVLFGKPGRGKTFQAAAILSYFAHRTSIMFSTVSDMVRDIKATFVGWESERDVISRYENAGVLCLDDLGKERLTEWSLPILFQILDKRKSACKPTIITTNLGKLELLQYINSVDLPEFTDALSSRFSLYTFHEVKGEDRRRNVQ